MVSGPSRTGTLTWRDGFIAWLLCVIPRLAVYAALWPNIRLDSSSVDVVNGRFTTDLATALWAPAYEGFAALLGHLMSGHPALFGLSHIIIHALVGVATLSLCRSLALSARASWISVAAVAFLPYFVATSVRQVDVGFVITVCAAAVALTVRWWTSRRGGPVLVAAAMLLLFLTRANALSMIAAMYAAVWLWPCRIARREVVLSVLAFAMGLGGWSAINAARFGTFTPFPATVGLNLWYGNHPGVSADLMRRDFNPATVASPPLRGGSAYDDDLDSAAAARAYMRAHPAETAVNAARKFARYWDWRLDDQLTHTTTQQLAYAVPFLLMVTLAAVGAVALWQDNRLAFICLSAVIIGYMAPHLLAYGMIRHRMSVEWATLIAAAVGVDVLARMASRTYSLRRND